jgi:hypothetical protein
VKGFKGHPGVTLPVVRMLDVVPMRVHADADALKKLLATAAAAKLVAGKFDDVTRTELKSQAAGLTDAQVRADLEALIPQLEAAAARRAEDAPLLAEVKRLRGIPTFETTAPTWLRSIVGDEGSTVFGRIVGLNLNERTDGHKEAKPTALKDRVNDDTLKLLAGQDKLRTLELSGTVVTSAGLVHLKDLKSLEVLNICLTACSDAGFEHLAGLTKMKRMVVCASKITGSGFAHLGGMTQLESINLHSAPASDAGLEAIAKLTSLKRLEIVHTHVTDAGLKHIGTLKNLRQFHVHGPQSTATALVPALAQLTELYELDIYDKASSNESIQEIGKLPKLKMLRLFTGTFDDSGVAPLKNLATLEELVLSSPNFTDAGLEHLVGLKNLRKLAVHGSKVTPAGKAKLTAALPKLEIAP